MLIQHAYAQGPGITVAVGFLEKVNDIILFPLITLMMAVAFLFFLYGCFEYIINADNQAAREVGRQHIIWGIVGLFVMLTAMSILRLAVGTFGLNEELRCANNPNGDGCEGGPIPFETFPNTIPGNDRDVIPGNDREIIEGNRRPIIET